MQTQGIIITREHRDLNFGQTVDILNTTKLTRNLYILCVQPHGDSNKYKLRSSDVWMASKNMYTEILNKL